MSRSVKIILIALAAILVLGGLIMAFWKWRAKKLIMDGPDMVHEDKFDFSQVYLKRVCYSRGGGMLGDSNSLELNFGPTEDGRPEAVVEYYDQPAHNARQKHKKVRIGSYVVSGVQEIMDRYHMTEWKDLPKTDLIALDAPSTTFTYEFSDGTKYKLTSDLAWPDDAYEAVREICSYIKRCVGIKDE